MTLFQEVLALLGRLQNSGWGDVLGELSGIQTPEDLRAERQHSFPDCAGSRLVEPGQPAHSLLYHALAHPLVRVEPDLPESYPTEDDLSLVENWIYAEAGSDLSLDRLRMGVFAYQYRDMLRTPHKQHADLVFSRCGFARLGTHDDEYDRRARHHEVSVADDVVGMRVRPARYGLFLCREVGPARVSIMAGRQKDDARYRFLLPVHKLFPGTECLPGHDISIEWIQRHRTEKLRRAITHGGLRVPRGFDTLRAPFVRDSQSDPDLATMKVSPARGEVHIAAPPSKLITLAKQASKKGSERIVTFRVPRQAWPFRLINRRYTTLHILGNLLRAAIDFVASTVFNRRLWFMPRRAPEFVHIRHAVDPDHPNQTVDLGEIESRDAFMQKTNRGGYQAALYDDGICEGAVNARVEGLFEEATYALPAYSIVGAPDYFPHADQMALHEYTENQKFDGNWLARIFSNGGPEPLCKGRLTVNPDVAMPHQPARPAFRRSEHTVVSVVSALPTQDMRTDATASDDSSATAAIRRRVEERILPQEKLQPGIERDRLIDRVVASIQGGRQNGHTHKSSSSKIQGDPKNGHPHTSSYLPDGASHIFAPGWDVTYAGIGSRAYYQTFGLGSPYPEDVKLCAAGGGSWPAVSPDASRTYRRGDTPTAIPLLDRELGLHPNHPAKQESGRGWDGEYGPYLVKRPSGWSVDYVDLDRADYVTNVDKNLANPGPLFGVSSDALIRRMDALHRAVKRVYDNQYPGDTTLWIVHAVARGNGFRFIFVEPNQGKDPGVVSERGRFVVPISKGWIVDAPRDGESVREALEAESVLFDGCQI